MIPLIDLHLHLDGSISLSSAKELLALENKSISDDEIKNMLTAPPGCDLTEYLKRFEFPLSLLQTKKSISLAVSNLLSELENEGLVYAEIRFAPMLHQERGLSLDDVVEAALEGREKSHLKCNFILCMMRHASYDENKKTIDLAYRYLNKGVVALDLAGDESKYKTEDFASLFEYAKGLSIPFTIHAGEASGAKSVYDAINMGASRIGHGIRALESDEVVSLLKDKKIPLEICPKSNIDTGVYESIDNYPLNELINKGIIVTINTDDMSVSDITLTKQFKMLEGFNLNISELLLNSVFSSFADDETKKYLKDIINEYNG